MNTKIYEKYIVLPLKKKKKTPEFGKWSNMRDRCNQEGEAQRRVPTYIGCSMAECFMNEDEGFQYFAEWCQHQRGFKQGYQLDKDLLFPGNKIYSPKTCVFVPSKINNMLINPFKEKEGQETLPVGVRQDRGAYKVDLAPAGKQRHEKLEDAVQEALIAKVKRIHETAEEYEKLIDPRLYEELKKYDNDYLKKFYDIKNAEKKAQRELKINFEIDLEK